MNYLVQQLSNSKKNFKVNQKSESGKNSNMKVVQYIMGDLPIKFHNFSMNLLITLNITISEQNQNIKNMK